jgi:proline-rich tail region repeat protein
VTDEKLAAVARRAPEPASPTPPAEPRQGMVDRLRGWWQ